MKNFRAKLFFRAWASCSKFWMIKYIKIQYSEFRAHSVFQGIPQVAQKSWKIKNISPQCKVSGQLCFSEKVSCSKIWMIKNQWRAVREGKEGSSSPTKSWNVQNESGIQNNKLIKNLSFHVEKVQLLYDSICVFLLQVKGKSRREAPTACAPLTGWLSHWAVCHKLWWWALAVQSPLCQLCNLHVSNSVMFVYTFNICTPFTICSRIT